ncbi:MAG: alpha-amylase [Gammaproteobacteria bacterium]|nr:alpha-amylase [Gammaproteobacteria bacterium]
MALLLIIAYIINSQSPGNQPSAVPEQSNEIQPGTLPGKPVIYQVLPRLFGNSNTTNKPWGTSKENGVGKFNDFSDKALLAIKEYGVSHIWYTGALHHALIGDYTSYGIDNDDPDVVKGRAGSPYAIKDYYNVNPDLAVDPANRLEEFRALIERTHKHGMKVIIDIVPNHIARNYHSTTAPDGVKDFGQADDTSVEYHRDNNFYYVVGGSFKVPESEDGYKPLDGESHPLSDGAFYEVPAKWTGNGSRKAQPDFYDWYETVKVNYGVRADGSFDFTRLPPSYKNKSLEEHYQFWATKDVPDSWEKFKDIVLYWLAFGVDGFRYDMAEMVPVEFWSYLNSNIKTVNPDAFLIAEVYNRKLYRDYLQLGKMDYLYDKVDFYDTLKLIMQDKKPTSALLPVIDSVADIDQHMLHFLENHDEQRIASADFAGEPNRGKPAMVVSALIGKSPTMLYFAQALGEAGDSDAGFGKVTRTTIFDYWGIASLQRWINDGTFDGGGLTEEEKSLHSFYIKLLSFSAQSSALNANYADLHQYNSEYTKGYEQHLFSFSRWDEHEKLIIISNFSDKTSYTLGLQIPEKLIKKWTVQDGEYQLQNQLDDEQNILRIENGKGFIQINLQPYESKILRIK